MLSVLRRLALTMLVLVLGGAAYAAPLDLKADFNAVCDGVADDTGAFNLWSAAGATSDLTAPAGRCRIASQPAPIAHALKIEGRGIDHTVFVRDFDGTAGLGLFTLGDGGSGSVLRGFSVISAPGRVGGHALVIASTANYATSYVVVDGVKFSSDGTNSWLSTVRIDGSAKTSAPKGVRDITFTNVHVFGTSGFSLELKTAIGFTWHGGGAYSAAGTGHYAGAIQISGSASHPSQYVNIHVANLGVINLPYCYDVAITSPTIGIGNGWVVETAGTAVNVSIRGQTYPGSGFSNAGVQSSWQNSSLALPDGTIVR